MHGVCLVRRVDFFVIHDLTETIYFFGVNDVYHIDCAIVRNICEIESKFYVI